MPFHTEEQGRYYTSLLVRSLWLVVQVPAGQRRIPVTGNGLAQLGAAGGPLDALRRALGLARLAADFNRDVQEVEVGDPRPLDCPFHRKFLLGAPHNALAFTRPRVPARGPLHHPPPGVRDRAA